MTSGNLSFIYLFVRLTAATCGGRSGEGKHTVRPRINQRDRWRQAGRGTTYHVGGNDGRRERGLRNRAGATAGDEADDDQSINQSPPTPKYSAPPLLCFAFFGSSTHRVGAGRVVHLSIYIIYNPPRIRSIARRPCPLASQPAVVASPPPCGRLAVCVCVCVV